MAFKWIGRFADKSSALARTVDDVPPVVVRSAAEHVAYLDALADRQDFTAWEIEHREDGWNLLRRGVDQ